MAKGFRGGEKTGEGADLVGRVSVPEDVIVQSPVRSKAERMLRVCKGSVVEEPELLVKWRGSHGWSMNGI